MAEVLNILLGAGIASVVPIFTLVQTNSRWKKERKIEHLKVRYNKLENIYLTINEALPIAVKKNEYPSKMSGLILTHGSEDMKKLFADFVRNKEKNNNDRKNFILEMSIEANKHLIEIDKEIERILS